MNRSPQPRYHPLQVDIAHSSPSTSKSPSSSLPSANSASSKASLEYIVSPSPSTIVGSTGMSFNGKGKGKEIDEGINRDASGAAGGNGGQALLSTTSTSVSTSQSADQSIQSVQSSHSTRLLSPQHQSMSSNSPKNSASAESESSRPHLVKRLHEEVMASVQDGPVLKRANNDTQDRAKRKKINLDELPRNCLSLIAFNLIAPVFPQTLPSSSALSSSNQEPSSSTSFTGRPSSSTSTSSSTSAKITTPHPSLLISLLLTSKSIHSNLSIESNPQLYYDLFRATFDYVSLTRRYEWMRSFLSKKSGGKNKPFLLFSDPRSWAVDYTVRWDLCRRMRIMHKRQTLKDKNGDMDKEQVIADLWTQWFLITENDGKNVPFLADYCHFSEFVQLYFREGIFQAALNPGLPKATGEKSLHLWTGLLSGTDALLEESAEAVDEKLFTLRPFVIGCVHYDIAYAAWRYRRLPLCTQGCTDAEHTKSLKSVAIPYKRFGYTWRRAPPSFILGCYLMFFRLVERQNLRVKAHEASPVPPSLFPSSSTRSVFPGLFTSNIIMPSAYHDREWQRNSVCQDPHTSPGLPSLTFQGELEGFWRGKFIFYDFDTYRRILGGDVKEVYTANFAEQAAEMELTETIIKVRENEVGGDGPMLAAGFREDDEVNGDHGIAEQERVKKGYGHKVLEGEEILEEDEPGWTKEILLSGRQRTVWGWARIRGRVRAWDGLVLMSVNYGRSTVGRWLFRGYLHTGGYFIGRWRDSVTPEHLPGYEGAMAMVRAGDILYPRFFPQTMAESEGLQQNAPDPSSLDINRHQVPIPVHLDGTDPNWQIPVPAGARQGSEMDGVTPTESNGEATSTLGLDGAGSNGFNEEPSMENPHR